MRQQGAWTRWKQVVEHKIFCTDLCRAEPHCIKFLLQTVFDVLPSPSNLNCWRLAETPACPLCQGKGTLEHIMSCRSKALDEGRYQWRHDQVLKAVAESINSPITNCRRSKPRKKVINFIRAGERLRTTFRVTPVKVSAALSPTFLPLFPPTWPPSSLCPPSS